MGNQPSFLFRHNTILSFTSIMSQTFGFSCCSHKCYRMGLLQAAILVGTCILQCAAAGLGRGLDDKTRNIWCDTLTDNFPYASDVVQDYDSDGCAIITHMPKPITEPFAYTPDASHEGGCRCGYHTSEWRCDQPLPEFEHDNECREMQGKAFMLEKEIPEAHSFNRNGWHARTLTEELRTLKKDIVDLREWQLGFRLKMLSEDKQRAATFQNKLDYWKQKADKETSHRLMTASGACSGNELF